MKEDADAEHRADEEGEAPAEVGIEQGRVQQHDSDERAERRADPETAIDDESVKPRYRAGTSS